MFGRLKNIFLSIPGSYGSVVNKQIDLYLKFKKECSESTENEILNMLLGSRIRTYSMLPRQYHPEEAGLYYEPLLEDDEKTLYDVIFHIVKYEFVVSRQDWINRHSTPKEQMIFETGVEKYISNQIEQRVAHK